MAFGTPPQYLGKTTGIIAGTSAPSTATDGFDALQMRFVNAWVRLTNGTSCDVSVYLYNSAPGALQGGWYLYTDVPTTTITTTNGGGVFQIETRGAQRVYVRLQSFVGANATADIILYGVNYAGSNVGSM